MSAPMVRAILNGSKTQTRRVVKPQPEFERVERFGDSWKWKKGEDWFSGATTEQLISKTGLLHESRCHYSIGQKLWVKETFCTTFDDAQKEWSPIYRADGKIVIDDAGMAKWKPSIFMPRKYSRITLEITGVSVQRLQEISEEDALEEGVEFHPKSKQFFKLYNCKDGISTTAKQSFGSLWMSIHGADSWDKNEWIWKIEFKNL